MGSAWWFVTKVTDNLHEALQCGLRYFFLK